VERSRAPSARSRKNEVSIPFQREGRSFESSMRADDKGEPSLTGTGWTCYVTEEEVSSSHERERIREERQGLTIGNFRLDLLAVRSVGDQDIVSAMLSRILWRIECDNKGGIRIVITA